MAALTHGHPSGWLVAGAFAAIISGLWTGHDLGTAVDQARTGRCGEISSGPATAITAYPRYGRCVRNRRSGLGTRARFQHRVRPSPAQRSERLYGLRLEGQVSQLMGRGRPPPRAIADHPSTDPR
ncbi:ADP-ribosylglycohydrolase family protein [Nocardia sp. NPDC059180]|uniref:ADP-ribosylglycohydrolase family protein n=1 Tax=Nocardia sp. NPDC059180 TaxID=3346761 RepID=UPI003687E008